MKNEYRPKDALNHCVYENYYHLIFCTYKRQPLLDIEWGAQEVLYENIEICVKKLGGRVERIEHDKCHVHILASLPPSVTLSAALQRIKGVTSRRVRQAVPGLGGKRLWSKSYYTATVGSCYDALQKYLSHHSHKE